MPSKPTTETKMDMNGTEFTHTISKNSNKDTALADYVAMLSDKSTTTIQNVITKKETNETDSATPQ
jgi:hypothetical protein